MGNRRFHTPMARRNQNGRSNARPRRRHLENAAVVNRRPAPEPATDHKRLPSLRTGPNPHKNTISSGSRRGHAQFMVRTTPNTPELPEHRGSFKAPPVENPLTL